MTHKIIEKTIMIDASPENVWKVFRDPKVTKVMGGYYVSDWKVGTSFGWKGNDGKMYTQGKILALEEGKLLEHNLYASAKSNTVTSVITYKINEKDGKTFLHGKEVVQEALDDEQYEEAVEGWDEALEVVKEIAEKL